MKSRTILTFLALFVLLSPQAHAKNKSVPKGDIKAIETAYNSLSDMTADFTQTTQIALLDRTVVKDGVLKFKKGGMWRIEYKGKKAKHYVSDGSTLWVYIPGDDTSLETFAVNDKTVPKEAMSFLSGFGSLTKEFKVSPSDSFDKAPKGSTALHLVPRKKGAQYEALDALFGPKHMLIELVVTNPSGNISRYKFNKLQENRGLGDDLFTLSSGKATPDTLPE